MVTSRNWVEVKVVDVNGAVVRWWSLGGGR